MTNKVNAVIAELKRVGKILDPITKQYKISGYISIDIQVARSIFNAMNGAYQLLIEYSKDDPLKDFDMAGCDPSTFQPFLLRWSDKAKIDVGKLRLLEKESKLTKEEVEKLIEIPVGVPPGTRYGMNIEI